MTFDINCEEYKYSASKNSNLCDISDREVHFMLFDMYEMTIFLT